MSLILKLNQISLCNVRRASFAELTEKYHRALFAALICREARYLVFQSARRLCGRVFYRPSHVKPQAAAYSKEVQRIPLYTTRKAKNARELKESK